MRCITSPKLVAASFLALMATGTIAAPAGAGRRGPTRIDCRPTPPGSIAT